MVILFAPIHYSYYDNRIDDVLPLLNVGTLYGVESLSYAVTGMFVALPVPGDGPWTRSSPAGLPTARRAGRLPGRRLRGCCYVASCPLGPPGSPLPGWSGSGSSWRRS